MQKLAAAFALPQDALSALSRDLARCLDVERTPLEIELPRPIAATRADEVLDATSKDMFRAADLLTRGLVRLDALSTADTQASTGFKTCCAEPTRWSTTSALPTVAPFPITVAS